MASAVPPSGASTAARRRAAVASAWRAAACQAVSKSAARATARAGWATGQGPSASRRVWRSVSPAKRKPTRAPARPKNLPRERNTIRLGASVLPARSTTLRSGSGSAKASSTISTPPRLRSVSAAATSVSRSSAVAVGLLGLHRSTLGVAAASARAKVGRRRSLCPARAQACGCSSYSGATQATTPRGNKPGRPWMPACEPGRTSRRGLP